MLRYISILLIAVLGFSLHSYHSLPVLLNNYAFEDGSSLYLEGSSNVKDFSCDCTDDLPTGSFSVRKAAGNLFFSNTGFRIPARSFDCGHRGINKDMYETLKTDDHPYITIQLEEVKDHDQLVGAGCDLWVNMEAVISMKIAGTSRQVTMPVRAKNMADGRLHCKGSQSIYLSDFGLEAPRPMLGLIKVDDCIRIHLDLLLRLD